MPNNTDHPLQGKKILFFAPAFFNYEKVIRDKMAEMGATVYLYDERSVKGAFLRALNKIVPTWFDKYSYNYFHRIIEKHKDADFDFVVIIKSDMVPEKTLGEFRALFKNAMIILYLYDSIKEVPGIKKKFRYFDRMLTFDRADALRNNNLLFRPLFYSDDYIATGRKNDFMFDLAFTGTIHSDRFRIIKKLIKEADANNMRGYWFLYMQAHFMFYWYWLTKWEFKWKDKKLFTTKKKTGKEIAAIVNNTKVIIDIEAPTQNGLTMRTIEMLGLKKKLITTNRDIINYELYNPNNICVIDRYNPSIPKDFIRTEYEDLPSEIYNKYSLNTWLLDVLGVKDIPQEETNK